MVEIAPCLSPAFEGVLTRCVCMCVLQAHVQLCLPVCVCKHAVTWCYGTIKTLMENVTSCCWEEYKRIWCSGFSEVKLSWHLITPLLSLCVLLLVYLLLPLFVPLPFLSGSFSTSQRFRTFGIWERQLPDCVHGRNIVPVPASRILQKQTCQEDLPGCMLNISIIITALF